ncbi:hypothetical protein LCGC14_1540200 [marine sediment metagenome]|uniref:Uncharacterized protein n=1 Tax=marine sediment metagenome TaxID=412755 RepID=A0A0F9LU28_9ZZZZ
MVCPACFKEEWLEQEPFDIHTMVGRWQCIECGWVYVVAFIISEVTCFKKGD